MTVQVKIGNKGLNMPLDKSEDLVNNPSHYAQASATLEPIDVLRHAPFDLGNAFKYVMRYKYKGNPKQDLEKALKYANWALDSVYQNRDIYQDYWIHYAHLLAKFKDLDFMGDTSNAIDAIRTLIETIEDLLSELS